MERIVGEMEEEEQAEGGDNAADSMEVGDDQNQEDKEDGSEDAAVEHAEVEAQVHRGERLSGWSIRIKLHIKVTNKMVCLTP